MPRLIDCEIDGKAHGRHETASRVEEDICAIECWRLLVGNVFDASVLVVIQVHEVLMGQSTGRRNRETEPIDRSERLEAKVLDLQLEGGTRCAVDELEIDFVLLLLFRNASRGGFRRE